MLETIKKAVRIAHNKLDNEIQNDINTCQLELNLAGVYFVKTDLLMQKACELYVKWQIDFMGKGAQFETAYNKLKDAMALSGDYNVRPTNNTDE